MTKTKMSKAKVRVLIHWFLTGSVLKGTVDSGCKSVETHLEVESEMSESLKTTLKSVLLKLKNLTDGLEVMFWGTEKSLDQKLQKQKHQMMKWHLNVTDAMPNERCLFGLMLKVRNAK